MFKKVFVMLICVVLLLLIGAAGFASMYGFFEGYQIVKVVVDGQEIKGDVPAINFKGRTMVPVRFVSEALGADVTWDATNYTAIINRDGKPAPAPAPAPAPVPAPSPAPEQNGYTVKDATGKTLYSFKINRITEMEERNPYSHTTPAQVILIDYTYTNIASKEEVFLSEIFFKVVDAAGKVGYTYANTPTHYPQSIPIGATCTAQMIFGLDTKSSVVKLYFYKDIFGQATTMFEIPVK